MGLTINDKSWVSLLALSLSVMGVLSSKTSAQITPDTTLGAESSSVTPKGMIHSIEGGAIRGSNLFHSFLEFNVGEGQGVYFLNPTGIENILTRVTGDNPSKIFGTLGVLGNANLFLINPNGILFGPNARLDLKGSFFGSTADSINLADGTKFGATDSQAQPLLTISIPIGLQFRTNPGAIVNQSRATNSGGEIIGLQVQQNQTLSLIGGDLSLEGGYLTAEGGKINLGSVSDKGLVELKPPTWALGYDGVENFGDIQLSQAALVNASGSRGGTVVVQSDRLVLNDGSQIRTDTLGASAGGGLKVTAQDSLELGGISGNGLRSGLFSETQGVGKGGNLTIDTGNLIVRDGAQISVSTFGQGQGGNLSLKANHSVQLLGKDTDTGEASGFLTGLFAESRGSGAGGNVNIKTDQLVVQSRARISTTTVAEGNGGDININAAKSAEMIGTTTDNIVFVTGLTANAEGTGNAGDITINTRKLMADKGAEIISYAFSSGNSGNITVNANQALDLIGATTEGVIANSFIASATIGAGNAGDVKINTGKLTLLDGAQIGSGTFADGNSGNVIINAAKSVNLKGIEPVERVFPSGLFSQADFNAKGNGGDLTLTTKKLTLQDGARISVGTEFGSEGQGGTLKIIASDSIKLLGKNTFFIPTTKENVVTGSILFSQSRGSGDAGDMRVETGKFVVKDGAEVSVSATGTGTARNLDITAHTLFLDNKGKLTAESVSGEGGNITLKIGELLQLNRQSQISTTAGKEGGGGNGGNITIDAPFIVAAPSENSDITANAFEGRGGNINITTQGIFGIEFRKELTPLSDITASSQFGQSGFVDISAPNVNPSQGLVQLPGNPVDPSALVAQNPCAKGGASEFIVTGRGGLPPNPGAILDSTIILIDLGFLVSEAEIPFSGGAFLPARGWKLADNGMIVLTAEDTQDVSHLVKAGTENYRAGNFTDAIELWQRAASIFGEQGETLNQATILSNLAAAYKELGQWNQAKQSLTTAQQILEGEQGKGRTAVLAQILNTQGSIELALGNPEGALATWQRAGSIYAQIEEPIYAQRGVLRSQINQAEALQALGLNLRAETLLAQVNETLALASDELLSVAGLRGYGDILRLVGKFQESEEKLQQSLSLARKLSSSVDISGALLGLGDDARLRQDIEVALQYYQQAVSATSYSPLKIQAQLNLLGLLVSQKRLLAARALLPEISTEIPKLPVSRSTIYARINFAQSLSGLRRISSSSNPARKDISSDAEIIQLLENSVQQAREIRDKRAEAYALAYLGGEYERLQEFSKAKELIQQTIIIAQEVQAPDITYYGAWKLGRILNYQGDKEGAIAAYTLAFDTLQPLRSDLVTVNPEVQFSFRESAEPIYRELVSLLLEDSKLGKAEAQINLIQARRIIESLQLAELDNFFQDACSIAKPVQIDQIDPKTAVIYPIILPDRLEVILSLPGQPLRNYSTAVTQSQVETTVKKLQEALFEEPSNDGINNKYLPLAQNLYDWLISPAAPELTASGVTTLTFVLDGGLRNIPMAVLSDGKEYLIEKYAIALTPGLQLLDPQPLKRGELNALTGGLTEARQDFPALPNVARELKEINSELSSKMLVNQDFTEDALKDALFLTPFPILHLATHGQFSSKAEDTFILTWNDRINANDLNNLLRLSQKNRNSAVELLVLSACQTAAGDNRAALGLAGIAVRAGARSTLATLWFVDDQATSELMIEFYRDLANSELTKAQSLQRAQLSLLRDGKHQHPFYWAPFVLVGNWL